ncbi:hypothetical protein TNCV_2915591 [Trichonephila clavipes]|nr:hypothetical protein TNCV_2915591 [Trichonephila clavipes]
MADLLPRKPGVTKYNIAARKTPAKSFLVCVRLRHDAGRHWKRNAKRSSIPYLDSVCGLMWLGLPGSECPDWLVERGKESVATESEIFLHTVSAVKSLNSLNGTVVIGRWHCESRLSLLVALMRWYKSKGGLEICPLCGDCN